MDRVAVNEEMPVAVSDDRIVSALKDEIRMLEEKLEASELAISSPEPSTSLPRSPEDAPSPSNRRVSDVMVPKLGRELTLRDIYFMVRERWMLGVAVGILVAGGLCYWKMSRPTIYRADAEVLVKLEGDKALPKGLQELDEEFLGTDDYYAVPRAMQIHEKNFQSFEFLELVSNSFSESEIAAFAKPFIEREKEDRDRSPEERRQRQTELFQMGIGEGFEVSRDSERDQFLTLAYEHPDAEMATLVTNRYIEKYNEYIQKDSQKSQERAQAFLVARIEELAGKIEGQERDLQAYRKLHGITSDLDESGDSPELTNLAQQITNLNLEIVDREVELSRIKDFSGDLLDLAAIPSMSELGPVAAALARLETNDDEYSALDLRYLSRHPKMIANRSERQNILRTLHAAVASGKVELESQLLKKQAQRDSLESEMKNKTAALVEAKDPYVEFRVKQKQLQLNQGQYEQLLQRRNDSRIVGLLDSARISVVRPAEVPEFPVVPNRSQVMKLCIATFLLCSVGVPVGIGFFDTRLKSLSEAEVFLGKECLGVIAENQEASTATLGAAVRDNFDEPFTESFRVIYTTMDLNSKEPYPKVILVASSSPGEGKSTVAANLAAMFARHRKTTLIVDGDFRRPSQHKFTGKKNSAGLLRFLRAPNRVVPETPHDLVRNRDLGIMALDSDLLFLLRAGGVTRDLGEVVDNADFDRFFDVLRAIFDVIIIDTPPVGLFPDALLLSRYADESVFVCKHNHENRHKIKFALTKLENSESPVLGTIMNQMSHSRRHQYGYGYQDYGYGYYGNKDYADYYADREES